MAMKQVETPASRETRSGLYAALAAYVAWGFLPVYWKLLGGVPALEILSHRIVWSLLFVTLILLFQGRMKEIAAVFRRPRTVSMLFLSSLLIGVNWLLYIWAVNSGKVLETSLGYYINPLVSVLFGFVFFRERMEPIQWAAIAIATTGVLFQVIRYGRWPWVALGLALSFALYGLIRKQVRVEAIPGLFAETAFLVIPAMIFLLHAGVTSQGSFLAGRFSLDMLLLGTGVVTSMPLLWFAFGARRLRLSTIGFLQYIAPTLGFILGTVVFHEQLDFPKIVTFICIWIALGLYSLGSFWASRREAQILEKA
ncbi:MAG: EamA family transporter RarD [Thermovirgaceae bacterium]|nr:EamA family transporter RarD [Thermovirgaceae bacterium]